MDDLFAQYFQSVNQQDEETNKILVDQGDIEACEFVELMDIILVRKKC